MGLHVVLYQPEIPANTGNIGRTCVATGTALHLIRPLGFDIDEKSVKRAGLDYWEHLDLYVYDNFQDFIDKNPNAQLYMATTKAVNTYADVQYDENSFIMFGKESAGIPEEILVEYKEACIRIPMLDKIRSLNLSNSVSIILYEALRQHDFNHMKLKGELRNFSW